MTMRADLKSQVLAASRAVPVPTRRTARMQTAILIATGVAVAISLFLAYDGMHHGMSRPLELIVGTALGWLCVAIAATWGAFGRGQSMLGRSRRILIAIALAAPAVLFVWMAIWNVRYPDAMPDKVGWRCLGLTLAMAVWPLVALALARKATDPVHPRATGAALGSAAGAWAGIMTDLWCPLANPRHVAFGHILPMLILTAFGVYLGHRVIAVRRREIPSSASK